MTHLNLMDLEILCHYGYSPEHYNVIHLVSVASNGSHELLQGLGLIESKVGDRNIMDSAQITDRGNAHLKFLRNLPLPQQVWVCPEVHMEMVDRLVEDPL